MKYFAQTMQECFPKDSILGRYGGDEFVAYLKNVKPETVYACMESFQKKISHFTLSTGEVVELSASAGGVIFLNREKILYRYVKCRCCPLRYKTEWKSCI